MRYIIYTRVSKDIQTTKNQLFDCKKYVYSELKKGDEVFEFDETHYSSFKPIKYRKKFQEMVEFLKEGDTLVLWKMDRLAREKQELINAYCDIRNKGVIIHGIADPVINDEQICIYAFIACTERANIQKRTLTSLNRKRSEGERVGGTWYGYSLDESKLSTYKNAKSEGKPYLLIPNEKEIKQIEIMEEMIMQGSSYGDISKELTSKGHRNRKGNPIHKSTVYRVLKRLGKHRPNPMDVLKNRESLSICV